MKRWLMAFVVAASGVQAQDVDTIVQRDIIEGFATAQSKAAALVDAVSGDCPVLPEVSRAPFDAAVEAWLGVALYRFGPSEAENRGFALGFWPDPRGKTDKALRKLIAEGYDGPYEEVSIAARGYYALERLLFDEALRAGLSQQAVCDVTRAAAADVARTLGDIHTAWAGGYGAAMSAPSAEGIYRSEDEVLRQLYGTLLTALEYDANMRLAGPLGTFDRPRPKRAEMWRSQRSSANLRRAMEASRRLAQGLAQGDEVLVVSLLEAFDAVIARIGEMDDPAFAGVSTPAQRFRLEALMNDIHALEARLRAELGPRLGVSAGFNGLDGD